ncbi:hypothetical protein AQF52_2620 [Streptomyces venezuelae]|nr:hypothetical protein AQF52_2620 [Streptomyces venezuelae]CUM41431.1 hypothetical protein BN2537_11827 [Streptomyces venezuelae]
MVITLPDRIRSVVPWAWSEGLRDAPQSVHSLGQGIERAPG